MDITRANVSLCLSDFALRLRMLTFDVAVLPVELLDSLSQCSDFASSAQLLVLGGLTGLCQLLEPDVQL